MSATDLRTILFDLIPRKISAKSDQAPEAIREFQLFWTFLQREFHLENAAGIQYEPLPSGNVVSFRAKKVQ